MMSSMILLTFSAAFVGLVHSLAPGHWMPVVLMAKTKRWSKNTAVVGALVAASGHIFLSIVLGTIGIEIGVHFLTRYESQIEHYAGLLLSLFGLCYAGLAYFRHFSCKGHTHHGPDPKHRRWAFLFLFSLGFSPCVAALPVFAAAAPGGVMAVGLSMLAFALGVITALVGATFLALSGLAKLDHPFLEHHGDVITGLGIAIIGSVLFLMPMVH